MSNLIVVLLVLIAVALIFLCGMKWGDRQFRKKMLADIFADLDDTSDECVACGVCECEHDIEPGDLIDDDESYFVEVSTDTNPGKPGGGREGLN